MLLAGGAGGEGCLRERSCLSWIGEAGEQPTAPAKGAPNVCSYEEQ